MNRIKTILVDDEPISTKQLEMLINKHAPDIEIVATAKDVDTALELIYTLKPDLIFLDIELGGESGFDLLQKCHTKKFEVIFVTAHNQFGIEAVKAHAHDYILKPLNKIELIKSIEQVTAFIEQKRTKSQKSESTRISLSTMEGLTFVDLKDVIYIESDGRYSRFYLSDNQKILVSKNLGKFEDELTDKGFARIHNSYLVNIIYIEKYVKGRGGNVVLKNGKSLEVSSRKKDDFFDKM